MTSPLSEGDSGVNTTALHIPDAQSKS